MILIDMLKAQKNLPPKLTFLYQKKQKIALNTYFSIKNIYVYDYNGRKQIATNNQ